MAGKEHLVKNKGCSPSTMNRELCMFVKTLDNYMPYQMDLMLNIFQEVGSLLVWNETTEISLARLFVISGQQGQVSPSQLDEALHCV